MDERPAEAVFDERRRTVLALLGLPDDDPTVIGGSGYGMRGAHRDLCRLFARRKRPVMFYLHGGGFTMGSGGSEMFDGSALVRRGDVVVVTINHRVSAMG